MKYVWLQTSIQLGMDLGALRLCLCNHVGKISQRIPRLFQWFLTVVKSLLLWKRKRATSLFAKPLRQKAPRFPAQKLEKLKMRPHNSKKKRLHLWRNAWGSRSLKTTWWPKVGSLFFFLIEFFLLGSNESSTSPGFLLQRKVIARLSLGYRWGYR